MADLIEFLRACIAEREEAARACITWLEEAPSLAGCAGHLDPHHELARCAADRLILELHCSVKIGDDEPYCADDGELPPCPTLRALALPYADHPDYREEWRP
jgi:hypothetical protein